MLNVLLTSRTLVSNMPMANIMDNKPFVNILPFGICNSIANPTVAAATAAALGVLTPMPCIPTTPAPWMPGSPAVLVGNIPALTAQSQLMCIWGGVIQIRFPGQMTTVVA
ncbi:hypothetical protein TUM17569_58080 [Klebsiella oxytoca]|nr:hypothetical protein TUM17568_56280 [Klebsiella oxytoca]GJL00348.1 hypothetical protein TUM17569_58080 [Klebsiella oxytoca]